ncbi:MAG: hypothetical protein ABIF71_05345 [Planctomycetota bacterium]
MRVAELDLGTDLFTIACHRRADAVRLPPDPSAIVFPVTAGAGAGPVRPVCGGWLLRTLPAGTQVLTAAVPPGTGHVALVEMFLRFETGMVALNPAEQARAVALAAEDGLERAAAVARFVGLPGDRRVPDRCRAAAGLDEPWPRLMAAGRVSLATAAAAAAMDPDDRRALAAGLDAAHMTGPMQAQFLDALAAGERPAALWSRPALAAVIADPALSARGRGERLLEAVRALARPRYAADRAAFDRLAAAVGFDDTCTLRAAAFFESAGRTVAFTAAGAAAFRAQVGRLRAIAEDPRLDGLFES